MATDNNDKKNKLRKLLALADRATNEGEAMAALAKAEEYSKLYGLNLDDLRAEEVASNEFETSGPLYSGRVERDQKPWLNWSVCDWHLWKPLAAYCGVKVRTTFDKDGDNALEYFGHFADVDLAVYLRDTINRAFYAEWRVYRDFVLTERVRSNPSALDTAMYSFTLGMADRLRERMSDIRRQSEESTTGKELIVLKGALVEQKAREVGFVEHAGKAGAGRQVDGAAYASGKDSGNRVSMGRGVGSAKVKMIGR